MYKMTVKEQVEKVALANIPALRRSFVLASLMILIGVTLSHFVHEAFLILPILVGGGLMFSALVGWCPMAIMMEKCSAKNK